MHYIWYSDNTGVTVRNWAGMNAVVTPRREEWLEQRCAKRNDERRTCQRVEDVVHPLLFVRTYLVPQRFALRYHLLHIQQRIVDVFIEVG